MRPPNTWHCRAPSIMKVATKRPAARSPKITFELLNAQNLEPDDTPLAGNAEWATMAKVVQRLRPPK